METVFNGYNCSVFAYGTTGARKNLHDARWEGENSNVVPTLLGANVESSGLSRYHLPHHGGNLQENIHAGRQNLRGWNLLPRGLQRDRTRSPQSCRSVLVETRNSLKLLLCRRAGDQRDGKLHRHPGSNDAQTHRAGGNPLSPHLR